MVGLQNRVLSKAEILKVIKWSKMARRRHKPNTQRNFAIWRLSCCCGLRCKEIVGLNLGDFFLKTDKPFIRIRKEITKGHRRKGSDEVIRKARIVPLTVDRQTKEDLAAWLDFRMAQTGGDRNAPFVCSQMSKTLGKRMCLSTVAKCWQTSLLCLGRDRAKTTSIHSGRHTAISMLLHCGYSLPFVRDFAGHANISTTSLYAHVYENDGVTTEAFNFARATDRHAT